MARYDRALSMMTASDSVNLRLGPMPGTSEATHARYRGRVALYEVMPVTREVRALLESGTDEIHQAAIREGMTTLHQDGVRLCIQGVSSLEEIHRVAGERR